MSQEKLSWKRLEFLRNENENKCEMLLRNSINDFSLFFMVLIGLY